MLNELSVKAHEWSKRYRPKERRTPHALYAHMHAEVSEAWDAMVEGDFGLHNETKNGHTKPEGELAELADIVIMVAVRCGQMDYDLDTAVVAKFAELERRLEIKDAERALR